MKDYKPEPPAWDDFIPICPVCGKECDTVYLDENRDVTGCDRCIRLKDAYEYLALEDC